MKSGDLIMRKKNNTEASWAVSVGLYALSSGNYVRPIAPDEILFVLKVHEDNFGPFIDVLTCDGAVGIVSTSFVADQGSVNFEVIS